MLLSLHERERLMIYTAAKLAEERRGRGVKLNLPRRQRSSPPTCWRAPGTAAR